MQVVCFHPGAVTQVKQIGAALARSKGLEESATTSQLFGRLLLTLMRGNAVMLGSRCQEDIRLPPLLMELCDFSNIFLYC